MGTVIRKARLRQADQDLLCAIAAHADMGWIKVPVGHSNIGKIFSQDKSIVGEIEERDGVYRWKVRRLATREVVAAGHSGNREKAMSALLSDIYRVIFRSLTSFLVRQESLGLVRRSP